MAKNRKNQAAAIRFGPALKASFACLILAGAALGYVWQKNEIYRLGQQIRQRETRLAQLQNDNKRLGDQITILHSPVMLDRLAKELNLGLAPAQPLQVVRLDETPAPAKDKNVSRQFTQRSVAGLTP
ncbi:MAG TPA: septum formation initiator family protein [Candidatus Limnocylindrales bacterium]|nr:septum formation initiator family protein [Candidatus Limnocylindrales bacterium]